MENDNSASNIFKNPIMKNVLSAIAVAGFGFILLNLAFLFDYLFQTLIDRIARLFVSANLNMSLYWYPPMKHFLFLIVILLISIAVFRSKLWILLKAIYMTVPLAAIYVTIGIFFYQWPIIVYSLSGLFSLGVLYYFYRTKKPWLYFYTLILVGVVLLIGSLTGMEI